MVNEGFKRKLTAILSADAVGYSRLMREDEEATVRDIATHRVLIAKIIQQHHGRVIDSPGDNILAEFASVVDAVNGAIKIQEEINKGNSSVAEDRRMEFRIGINLGDVIEEEGRIYGDGVNIAARVEGLAAAGGISISGTVYEHIKDKLSLGYNYLGEQYVKNIPEPVRVYRLLTDPNEIGKMIGGAKLKIKKYRFIALSALGLIILVAGVLVFWNNYFRVKIEPASVEKMTFPLPEKPSIAVLPFENMSGDPKQEYLGDGFTEDLITTISKIPELFVISRHSTFSYKDKPVKVQKVAEELGVRYVLEGSIQKSSDKLRVTVQLIDAIKGHHLWSERYDRKFEDLFELKGDIILKVANELLVGLVAGEYLRAIVGDTGDLKPWQTNNLEAWETYWHATKIFERYTKEDNARARDLYTKALQLDPQWYLPIVGLCMTHTQDARIGWSESRKKSFELATELANKIVSIDEKSATVYQLLGNIHLMKTEYEKANNYYQKSLSLDPNAPYIHSGLGFLLNYLGKPQAAITHFKIAMRLSPFYPAWYLSHLGLSYHLTGQHEEAIKALKKGIERDPAQYFIHVRLAAVYSDLGREKEARAEVAEVLKIKPDFSVDAYAKDNPFKDKAIVAHRKELLRRAGLK